MNLLKIIATCSSVFVLFQTTVTYAKNSLNRASFVCLETSQNGDEIDTPKGTVYIIEQDPGEYTPEQFMGGRIFKRIPFTMRKYMNGVPPEDRKPFRNAEWAGEAQKLVDRLNKDGAPGGFKTFKMAGATSLEGSLRFLFPKGMYEEDISCRGFNLSYVTPSQASSCDIYPVKMGDNITPVRCYRTKDIKPEKESLISPFEDAGDEDDTIAET